MVARRRSETSQRGFQRRSQEVRGSDSYVIDTVGVARASRGSARASRGCVVGSCVCLFTSLLPCPIYETSTYSRATRARIHATRAQRLVYAHTRQTMDKLSIHCVSFVSVDHALRARREALRARRVDLRARRAAVCFCLMKCQCPLAQRS